MPRSTDEADSFLSRWSRRKLTDPPEGAAMPVETPEADAQIGHNSAGAEDAPELSDVEMLEKLGLPDPDTMVAGDDFRAFMESGIPQRFRNRALRRLWISNPILANLDEMVDYGEDFTDAATVVENLQTVYEVGVGAARKAREELDEAARIAEQLAAEAEAEAEEPDEAAPEPPEVALTAEEAPIPEAEPATQEFAALDRDTAPQEHLTLRKARPMRFEFD